MGDQGCARIQSRKTDGRRDNYTELFLILVSLHERKRQKVILTEGGRSHFLAFLAGQTPLFRPHHESGDRPVWGGASFLPRLVILVLMFVPRKVSRPNDVTRRFLVTRSEFVQQSTILQEDLKGKGKATDPSSAASEELAALVHLALSKHSIWVNPDLVSPEDGCTYKAQTFRHSSLELTAVRQTYHLCASFANPRVS